MTGIMGRILDAVYYTTVIKKGVDVTFMSMIVIMIVIH